MPLQYCWDSYLSLDDCHIERGYKLRFCSKWFRRAKALPQFVKVS
jgi:hypothetical protein